MQISLHEWKKISPGAPNSTAITASIFLRRLIAGPQHLDRSLFAFVLCFITILNQKEFRIATSVAMFTSDQNAGVVLQMSPPPHDLERYATHDHGRFYSCINKMCFHGSRHFIFTGSCSVYIIMRQLSRAKPGNPASCHAFMYHGVIGLIWLP